MKRLARTTMYGGVAVVVFGLSEYHGRYVGNYDFVETSRFGWASLLTFVVCVAAYGSGLPEVPRGAKQRVSTASAAALAGAAIISFLQLFIGDALLPRFVVFGSAVLVVPWFVAVSTMAAAGRIAQEQRDRVIVVGSAAMASTLAEELAAAPEKPASVVAHVDEVDARAKGAVSLRDLVVRQRGSVLVLSSLAQADESLVEQAALLHATGVRVRTPSLFYEEWLGKIPVAELARVSLFFDIGEVHRDRYSRWKRLVDVSVAAVGVLLLVVVVPVVALGNVVANRGPVFYRQERVGRHGDVFRIIKFRSMRNDHSGGSEWTQEDDPRITPFGRILRVSHADEIPQMWNILRGDLSLVGPRPEQPRYVAQLKEQLPFYDMRHIVRPGLTGWAQVKYGYAGSEQDAMQKLQFDFHYLRRQSLAFDLRIVGRTIRSVLGIEGQAR